MLPKKQKRSLNKKIGQTTVEYVMLIVVVVVMVLSVSFFLRQRLLQIAQGRIGNYLNQQFFSPAKLHRFPIKIPN